MEPEIPKKVASCSSDSEDEEMLRYWNDPPVWPGPTRREDPRQSSSQPTVDAQEADEDCLGEPEDDENQDPVMEMLETEEVHEVDGPEDEEVVKSDEEREAECKAESRTVFRISTCGHCGYRYEDFAPGYEGNGKRVILQGFCGDVNTVASALWSVQKDKILDREGSSISPESTRKSEPLVISHKGSLR
ncbi:UNVERIFIED_CONTAM: hypothetical protein FKN15_027353 [Acipenser sinensis]